MYNANNIKMNKAKSNTIVVECNTTMPKYNAYQGGYGTHGKTKNAKHKADRQANKKICANY